MRNVRAYVFALLALFVVHAAKAGEKEYLIVTGGVSLHAWEKFKSQPHDHWWANFVHASKVRMVQLRQQYGPDVPITWFVYRESYEKRSKQEGRDLIPFIESVRDACKVKLVFFNKTQELLDYMNFGQPRDRVKIANFEFYGHSNKACFMFDYSNEMDSASKCWLHEDELTKIRRGIFDKDAFIKSWGCHTGESMTAKWRSATGTRMWGAIGRTDYSNYDQVMLSDPKGKWVR